MEATRCLKCGGTKILEGDSWNASGATTQVTFVPRCMRSFGVKEGVSMAAPLHSCLSCGHVWTSLAPDKLRSLIQTRGGELAKQHLASLDFGPAHDLPDVAEARDAAVKTAEIDALVLAYKQPEATRRYRQLTTTTWDEAIGTIRNWHHFKRREKLAMFGWHSKETPKADELKRLNHPMSDPLLDF